MQLLHNSVQLLAGLSRPRRPIQGARTGDAQVGEPHEAHLALPGVHQTESASEAHEPTALPVRMIINWAISVTSGPRRGAD